MGLSGQCLCVQRERRCAEAAPVEMSLSVPPQWSVPNREPPGASRCSHHLRCISERIKKPLSCPLLSSPLPSPLSSPLSSLTHQQRNFLSGALGALWLTGFNWGEDLSWPPENLADKHFSIAWEREWESEGVRACLEMEGKKWLLVFNAPSSYLIASRPFTIHTRCWLHVFKVCSRHYKYIH